MLNLDICKISCHLLHINSNMSYYFTVTPPIIDSIIPNFKYSQTCVKGPYKTRHIFDFSDRWLLIAA